MNSMIQGAILGEGDAADLVAEAAEELEEYKQINIKIRTA